MPPSDDKEIWQAYTKKVKRSVVKSKKDNAVGGMAQLINKQQPLKNTALSGQYLSVPAQKLSHPFLSHCFDRRTERRLRDGTVAIEARLDLHGMTQSEAYTALQHFMATQIKAQSRTVLIITGKGKGGDGVLRSSLGSWLQSLPYAKDILAIHSAAIRHGGQGAFYVMLRRQKAKQ